MPDIPKALLEHPKARYVLYNTIESFEFEEQMAIYLYNILDLPVSEIGSSLSLSQEHVISILTICAERLAFKVDVFKKAVPYTDEIVHISEVFALEA